MRGPQSAARIRLVTILAQAPAAQHAIHQDTILAQAQAHRYPVLLDMIVQILHLLDNVFQVLIQY